MIFEFDNAKSQANRDKHGIDFAEAQALWDSDVLEIKARFVSEDRFLNIGRIDGKYWTAAITYRNGSVRIISVRRSRDKEVKSYEDNFERRI